MNAAALVLLLAALGAAAMDWVAVAHGNRRVEYAAKPATLALLVACALVISPASGEQRAWFVAALALSLAGDVFLVLPRDRFLPGLFCFLGAQLAYSGGFLASGFSAARASLAMTMLIIAGAVLMQRVVAGIRARHQERLVPVVVGYGVALSLTVALAFASRQPAAVLPAALFYFSDAVISFRRFVGDRAWMPVAIIVTYHLAQVGLVATLAL
ncbi:MAG: lysoplasmalogenase [Candidatus Dormibacteria bacterium]